MMTISNDNNSHNTPRTRNRLLDNSPLVESSEGYYKGDWTFRKQIEADFRALQFKSHKFSHKNEPEDRLADSLWFSWNSYSKNQPFDTAVEDIEVRVTFATYGHPDYPNHETTFHVSYDGRSRGGCIARRMGKMKMVIENYDTTDIFAHINHILTKKR